MFFLFFFYSWGARVCATLAFGPPVGALRIGKNAQQA